MDVRIAIEQEITKIVADLGVTDVPVALERPGDISHGDWASPVALSLASRLGQSSRDIAERIAREIVKKNIPHIASVSVAGGGFVNIFLTKDFFAAALREALADEKKFGSTRALAGKTVLVEYTQPNPFKPFHIGHLMSNTIGEALTRMFENAGARVMRANYQGDVGLHVAKALWGMEKKGVASDDIAGIGDAYAYGHEMYETDTSAQQEIVALNKKIYAHDPAIEEVYQEGRKATLDAFEKIYALLGTKFDMYFFESEVWEKGMALVTEGLEKNIFEKSEGAVIFPGERYGLHTRVFVTKDGVPTYEAKELGLALLKTQRAAFDLAVTVTAVEQEQYFTVVCKALELLRPEYAGVFTHVHHGMMVLPSGKMSSRKGNVITGESLLFDMIGRAKEKVSERGVENADAIAQDVAVGAIKYMVLKQGLGKNIVFDQEKSLSFEGDSGPYLQYTLTRARSVLERAASEKIIAEVHGGDSAPSVLERRIERFSEKALESLQNREPSVVTHYLVTLSSEFNAWYAQQKIVDAGDPTSPHNVAVTRAVAAVLHNGLSLLGIPTPQKM